jgi:hypothetical protein
MVEVVNRATQAVDQIVTIAEPLTPLLEKVELFTDVVNKIAEVCDIAEYHPGFLTMGPCVSRFIPMLRWRGAF